MRIYRKTVGWTVRIIIFPVLVLYLVILFLGGLLVEIMERSLRVVLEFGVRMEAWEAAEAKPEWRPLRESVLEQRETDWTPVKEEDRLDT